MKSGFIRSIACLILPFLMGMGNDTTGQTVLSLQDALKIALENNYAIQIARNDAELARNNNSPGAAGMLPYVNGTASQDNQVINSRQKFLNGTENNRDNAKIQSLSAGVELGWTIFDGLRMFAAKNRLEELQEIGELKMRSNIELIFLRVTRAYYDVMLTRQQLKVQNELVESSQQRFDFTQERFKAGKSARTESLRAQVDLNTDKASAIRALNSYRNAQTTLNQILARDIHTLFEVPDTLPPYQEYKLEELSNKALKQNAGLQAAKKNQQVYTLNVREIRAERMPVIQLKGGYNFSQQQSQAGFLQSSQLQGPHFGAGLSLNLFNGNDVNRRLQNAKINMRTGDFVYRDSLSRLENAISLAYNNYLMSTQLVAFERENLEVAKQNFEIATEQYRVGVITSLELRDAQQDLSASKLRLLNAHYEAKLNETELLRLTGELVKL